MQCEEWYVFQYDNTFKYDDVPKQTEKPCVSEQLLLIIYFNIYFKDQLNTLSTY